jgi:hypothetical protein
VSRWDAFAKAERNTIHHALRMLAKYPDEAPAATPIADELWAKTCADLVVKEIAKAAARA